MQNAAPAQTRATPEKERTTEREPHENRPLYRPSSERQRRCEKKPKKGRRRKMPPAVKCASRRYLATLLPSLTPLFSWHFVHSLTNNILLLIYKANRIHSIILAAKPIFLSFSFSFSLSLSLSLSAPHPLSLSLSFYLVSPFYVCPNIPPRQSRGFRSRPDSFVLFSCLSLSFRVVARLKFSLTGLFTSSDGDCAPKPKQRTTLSSVALLGGHFANLRTKRHHDRRRILVCQCPVPWSILRE